MPKACHIRNNIRDLRVAAGDMTQQHLADRVGVTRQTIFAIEKEKYSPSLDVAFRIAGVFGVGLDDVFSFDPE
jgi:putative transcriptional regulator